MTRSGVAAWLVAGSLIVACDRPPPGDQSEGLSGYRVSVPGRLLARFPPDPLNFESGQLIEGAFGMTPSADGDAVFVLDVMAKRIIHLGTDMGVRAAMGRAGPGPGELMGPTTIQADPRGGVWVADVQSNRLSRYGADGSVLHELQPAGTVVNFGVLPGGGLVYPTLAAVTLLAIQTGEEVWDLEVDASLVPREISGGPMARLAQGALQIVPLAEDTIVLFQNAAGSDFRAWRAALGSAGARITDVSPIPLPAWLYDMIDREMAELPEGWDDRTFVPFKSVRAVGGVVWLAPSPTGRVIAVSLPRASRDSADLVLPIGDEVEGMIDAVVLRDRLVALYPTEVRVYELVRRNPISSLEEAR